jgi:hypothetical protein
LAVAALALVVSASAASAGPAGPSRSGFAFSADDISGAPAGSVNLSGAGAFDSTGMFVQGGGAFLCTTSVGQGPLAGCRSGEGVRWHTDTPLTSTPFRCAADAVKTGTPGPDTAVFRAEFFRADDGNTPSFAANVIVSAHDIAPDLPGLQTVWIQGVGCADASVHHIG